MTEAGGQWPGYAATYCDPPSECREGLGEGVPSVGDCHDLAVTFGAGLGAPHHDEHAAGLGLNVGDGERGQLETAEAMPSRMTAASRTRLGVAIWRASATPSGRALAQLPMVYPDRIDRYL